MKSVLVLSCIVVVLASVASGDVNSDKSECANQLVGLATCLPYVGGQAKTPTPDCCTGLKQVLDKSKKCLCLLIKDRDDPSLGLQINATLAAALPSACHSTANVSECITLLHLSPTSPDAKIFQGFANITKSHNSSSSSASTGQGSSTPSSEEKSDGGKAERWIASGILVLMSSLQIIF